MGEPQLKSYTRARPGRADVSTPIGNPIEPYATEALFDEPPAKPVGTLTRQIEYRKRTLTVRAVGLTLDTFYAALATANGGGHLFTISVGEHYLEEFVEIEFTNMTLDGFCNMLDKRLGVPS